jgi:hypothetical protein
VRRAIRGLGGTDELMGGLVGVGPGVVAFMIREVRVVRPNEHRKTSGVRVRMEYPGRARDPSPK